MQKVNGSARDTPAYDVVLCCSVRVRHPQCLGISPVSEDGGPWDGGPVPVVLDNTRKRSRPSYLCCINTYLHILRVSIVCPAGEVLVCPQCTGTTEADCMATASMGRCSSSDVSCFSISKNS